MTGRLFATPPFVLARRTALILSVVGLAGCASTDAAMNRQRWSVDSAAPASVSTRSPGQSERITAVDSRTVPAAREADAADAAESVESLSGAVRPDLTVLEDEWGIRVVSLRMTAGGRMVDFRYRVVDAEKALPVFSRKEKPFLVDAETGKALGVPSSPKLGPLRTSDKPIVDRSFFILFGNPTGLVRSGSRVDLVVGELRIGDLTVQ